MRADVQPFISPLDILKYAEHFERLYDVEKATFFNVIGYMESHKDLFLGKKIFINSIPGNRLIGRESISITNRKYRRWQSRPRRKFHPSRQQK